MMEPVWWLRSFSLVGKHNNGWSVQFLFYGVQLNSKQRMNWTLNIVSSMVCMAQIIQTNRSIALFCKLVLCFFFQSLSFSLPLSLVRLEAFGMVWFPAVITKKKCCCEAWFNEAWKKIASLLRHCPLCGGSSSSQLWNAISMTIVEGTKAKHWR